MNDKDRLQVCWQAFSTENSLLQSYRALFMAVEAALFGFGYALFIHPGVRWMTLFPAIFAWAVVGMWIGTCKAKGGDVDRWMERIRGFQSIVKKDWSIVGKGWFDYLKPGVKWSGGGIARILFNYVILISIAVVWGFVVRLPPPL